MAERDGRNSKVVGFRRWRCAISRFSPVKTILFWPRMAAGSGLLMILRRGALSPLSFFRRRQPLFRRDQCSSSALKAVVAGPTATPYLLAIIRQTPLSLLTTRRHDIFLVS